MDKRMNKFQNDNTFSECKSYPTLIDSILKKIGAINVD